MASLRERLAKQKEDLKRSSSGGKFFTVKEGTTRVRILNTGEENDFAQEVTFFYLGKDIGGVVSPASFGKKCAIMEASNKFKESKDEKDREYGKNNLRPGRKFFSVALKYKDEKGKEIDTEAGEKLILLTGGQYQEMIDLFLDEDEAGDFTDPVNGYDLKLSRTGKTKTDTEYTVRACKPTSLPKEYKKKTFDLTQMIKDITPTYEETKELRDKFLNTDFDKATEGEDEDKPVKKKKKKSKDL